MNLEHILVAARSLFDEIKPLIASLISLFILFLLYMYFANIQLSWSPLGLFDITPDEVPVAIKQSEEYLAPEEESKASAPVGKGEVSTSYGEPISANFEAIGDNEEKAEAPRSERVSIDSNFNSRENSVETRSPETILEQSALEVSDAGNGALAFSVPANRSVLIQSTKDAHYSQRFNVFREATGRNEWMHVDSTIGSSTYAIPPAGLAKNYLITAEHKNGNWKKSFIKNIQLSGDRTEIRFEDSGHNIAAGIDYDLLLVMWME